MSTSNANVPRHFNWPTLALNILIMLAAGTDKLLLATVPGKGITMRSDIDVSVTASCVLVNSGSSLGAAVCHARSARAATKRTCSSRGIPTGAVSGSTVCAAKSE